MNDYVYLVFSNPVAGKEDEYNRYYDGTHLPELLAIPGLARATRYETAADRPDQDPIEGYAYVCIYEFDDDPIETLDRLGEVRAAGGLTPTDAISRDPGPRAVLFKRRSQVEQ